MSVVELTKEEVGYVDTMVAYIVSSSLPNGTLNPDMFRGLVQCAYRSALICLEVRKDYVKEKEVVATQTTTTSETIMEDSSKTFEIMEGILKNLKDSPNTVVTSTETKVKTNPVKFHEVSEPKLKLDENALKEFHNASQAKAVAKVKPKAKTKPKKAKTKAKKSRSKAKAKTTKVKDKVKPLGEV